MPENSPVDLTSLSAPELRKLIADAETSLRTMQESRKTDLLTKWQAEAEENGLTIEAVLASRSTAKSGQGRKDRKGKGSALPAKFKGPNGEEWTGRGRLPKWLQAMEAEGRKREEFSIPNGKAS